MSVDPEPVLFVPKIREVDVSYAGEGVMRARPINRNFQAKKNKKILRYALPPCFRPRGCFIVRGLLIVGSSGDVYLELRHMIEALLVDTGLKAIL